MLPRILLRALLIPLGVSAQYESDLRDAGSLGAIRLAGSEEKVQWKRTKTGIEIQPSAKPVFSDSDWPVLYVLDIR